jgi:hypothetical protein
METAKRQLTNQLSLIEGAEQKLVDETTKKQKLQEKLQRKSGKKKEAAKVEVTTNDVLLVEIHRPIWRHRTRGSTKRKPH